MASLSHMPACLDGALLVCAESQASQAVAEGKKRVGRGGVVDDDGDDDDDAVDDAAVDDAAKDLTRLAEWAVKGPTADAAAAVWDRVVLGALARTAAFILRPMVDADAQPVVNGARVIT